MRLLPIVTCALAMGVAHEACASQFGAILSGPAGAWLLFACALVGLCLFASVCRQASHYFAEKTHASAVARLMDVLASQADGIAGMLLSHPPASGDTLQIVRQAAIAQSIAYAKLNLPGTIAQVGATDGVMATRLGNFVSQKTLGAAAAAPVIAGDDAAADVTRGALAATTPQAAALPAA